LVAPKFVTPQQKSERIRKITDAVLSLPVLPTVTSKILQVVDHPRANAGMLADLVSRDQVLTAKVLKMANSSYYGFSREIGTVRQAVVLLGFNVLRDLALSSSVFNLFRGVQSGNLFNISEFWKHSMAVGLASRYLSEKFVQSDPSFSFTAGLLHDLGKIVFHQYLPVEYAHVMTRVHNQREDLCLVEVDVLGASHDQVGGWLARRWKLPEELEIVLAQHHEPHKASRARVTSALVQLADYLTCVNKIGENGRKSLPPLGEESWEWLAVHLSLEPEGKEDQLRALAQEVLNDYESRASEFFSVMGA